MVGYDYINAYFWSDEPSETGILYITGDIEGVTVTFEKNPLALTWGVATDYAVSDWTLKEPDSATAIATFTF